MRPYHVSIQITNPLSAMSKYGGYLEYRQNQSSVVLGLTDYVGGYQGLQYHGEYQFYFKSRWKDEYFMYFKGCGGSAQYVADNLALVTNDKSKEKIGPYNYAGGAIGVGRRWNFDHLCILMNVGLKYVNLTGDISDEARDRFRIFYTTGPGAVLEVNFRFGYQF